MGINWNGVPFHETPVVDGGPDFSFLPSQESRYQMRGWFDWNDVVTQAATKAYAGWCQVTTGFLPNEFGIGNPSNIPPATLSYFNYTNPFPHPDWPNQMYLCEGFGSVKGSLPASPMIGANQTAVFDEAHTTLHFRSPKNGYRTLEDIQTLALVFPNGGANGVYIPREYYCLRNMEVIEKAPARSQTIPPNAGLQWQTLAPPAGGAAVGNGTNVAAANFITTFEGEITIHWYPVPLYGFNESVAQRLIGRCNLGPFPRVPLNVPGQASVRSMLTQRSGTQVLQIGTNNGVAVFRTYLPTLVWGQYEKEIIRQGDTSWAYKITLHLKWYPHGANAFYWWNPPAGARGRINIDANGPFQDSTLGGPGYYLIQRPDGTQLFDTDQFDNAFLPNGALV